MAEVISVVGVVDVVYLVHSWPCSFIQFIRCSCAQEVKEQWELEVAQVLGISWIDSWVNPATCGICTKALIFHMMIFFDLYYIHHLFRATVGFKFFNPSWIMRPRGDGHGSQFQSMSASFKPRL